METDQISVDLESFFSWIDAEWPLKRTAKEKELEKMVATKNLKTEKVVVALKTKLEILICDNQKTPQKLPPLVDIICNFTKKTVPTQIVSTSLPNLSEAESEAESEADKTFKDLIGKWPENLHPQNRKHAEQAFKQALKTYSLGDLKKACERYIKDAADPERAYPHVMGMKRFVSDDEKLEHWLQIATCITTFDSSYFDAAYSWYPDFNKKDNSKTKEDSMLFYKRFIQEDRAVEFYCAVKAYRDECRYRQHDEEEKDDFVPGNENRYTKTFVNFIREWKKQKCFDEVFGLLYMPYYEAMKKKGWEPIYDKVYPSMGYESGFCGAVKGWVDKVHRETGEYDCVSIVTRMMEYICECATTGNFYGGVLSGGTKPGVKTEPDYSIVSEVISIAKETAKKKFVAPHVIGE